MKAINAAYSFMQGGGEMGRLTREKDWTKTAIGDPGNWPQSLRTTLGIVLNSKFPMFLWWGPELTCFYNDAYRPSLGQNGKHPTILGACAQDAWPEIWDIIKPLIDQVLAAGEATWSEDQLIPIFRNGHIEDVYWTFSYSPVKDESSHIAGILVTCTETTDKINTAREKEESELRFRTMADNIPNLAWMANADGYIYWYNKRWYEYSGSTPEEMEGWGWQSLHDPRVLPSVMSKWQNSIASGAPFEMVFPLRGADGKFRQFLTRVIPVRNDSDEIYGWFGSNTDITQQVAAEEAAMESKKQLEFAIEAARLGTWEYFPLTDKFSSNERLNEWFGLPGAEKTDFNHALDAIHDDDRARVSQAIQNALDFSSGGHYDIEYTIVHPLTNKETNVRAKGQARFTDKKIANLFNGTLEDITEQTIARKKIEQTLSELEIFKFVIENVTDFIGICDMDFKPFYVNKEGLQAVGLGSLQELQDTAVKDFFFPEDINFILDVFYAGVLKNGQNECEIRFRHFKTGEAIWMIYNVVLVKDGNENPIGYATISKNITGQKDIEIELRQANDIIKTSENRFREMVEQAPVAICVLRGENYLVEVANPMLLEVWGKTSKQVMNKPLLEAIPEISGQGLDAVLSQVYKTGYPYLDEEFPFTIIRDGKVQLHYLNFVYDPLYNSKGRIDGVIAVGTDVTDQVIARQKIQENAERLRTVLESLPQMAWTTLPNGDADYFSRNWYEYTGQQYEEALGSGWTKALHPSYNSITINTWQKALKESSSFELETKIKKASDGKYRWVLVNGTPIKNEQGEILLWVGTVTDIDERKSFSQELENMVQLRTMELENKNNELISMNKELESFAYISSHDLQEPLRKIQTFASILIKQELPNLSKSGLELFNRMQNAAERMQVLINDLLAYSRTASAERLYQGTDLNTIVDEVKDDLKEDINQRHAIIETINLEEIDIIPFQFRQLLLNLVSNALKFAAPGRTPYIIIKSEQGKGAIWNIPKLDENETYFHISVSDNGIGFETAYSEKIFELFKRLHGRTEYKGTGIGLAIVKKIVENHNGFITAKGEINAGATFDIYLPAKA